MDLHVLLRKAAAASGNPRAALARQMGVSRAHITQLLSDRSNPSWKALLQFFRACGKEPLLSLSERKPPAPIPKEFHPLFWDANLAELNPAIHGEYLMERILAGGGPEAWRWLFSVFPRRRIRRFLKRSSWSLDRRSRNFWNLLLEGKNEWQKPKHPIRSSSWSALAPVRK